MDNPTDIVDVPTTKRFPRLDRKTIKVALASALVGGVAVVVLSKRMAPDVTVVDINVTEPKTETVA